MVTRSWGPRKVLERRILLQSSSRCYAVDIGVTAIFAIVTPSAPPMSIKVAIHLVASGDANIGYPNKLSYYNA